MSQFINFEPKVNSGLVWGLIRDSLWTNEYDKKCSRTDAIQGLVVFNYLCGLL